MNFQDKIREVEDNVLRGLFDEEALERRKFLYDKFLFPEKDSIIKWENSIRRALSGVFETSTEIYLDLDWSISHPCNYLKINYPNIITSTEISNITEYPILDILHNSSVLSMRDIIDATTLKLILLKPNEPS